MMSTEGEDDTDDYRVQRALYGVLTKLGHLGRTLLTLEGGDMMEGGGRGPPQHTAFLKNTVYSAAQPNDDTQPTIKETEPS